MRKYAEVGPGGRAAARSTARCVRPRIPTSNLGQGACQALEDAATLAAALSTGAGVESALGRYDAERRPRSQSVARAARQAGRMGQQLSRPVAVALHNTALRLAPSRVTVRPVLRHADWTPPRLG